ASSLSFSSHPPPPPLPSTLSLHDALPIFDHVAAAALKTARRADARQRPHPQAEIRAAGVDEEALENVRVAPQVRASHSAAIIERSEEHTSELQSRSDLVCRLLLEKKKKNI